MKFNIQVERRPESNQALAVYLRLREGQVAKTVEVCEDECYADEDANGRLLGIEMLAPGKLTLFVSDLEGRYIASQPDIELLLKEAMESLKSDCFS